MSGQTALIPIIGTNNPNRQADIIFVHGLGGDAHGTWHPRGEKNDNNFWPRWLGEDFNECGIWSVNYQVEPATWKGNTMPLLKRATNVVDLLDGRGLGQKPIIFITHSMGGLVIKQLLLNATYSDEETWKRIVEQTKGIVYLSTPHSGSNIANWFRYIGGIIGATVNIKELEANNPALIDLNAQYCSHEKLSKIPVLVYYEGQKMKLGVFTSAIVVDEESANLGSGIEDIKFVQLDEDHISISKPNSKGHPLYLGVKQFIEKCLPKSEQSVGEGDRSIQKSDTVQAKSNSESKQGVRNIYKQKSNFANRLKKEGLEKELAARQKDYKDVNNKYIRETRPAEKNSFKAEIDYLEQDIKRIERELDEIN